MPCKDSLVRLFAFSLIESLLLLLLLYVSSFNGSFVSSVFSFLLDCPLYLFTSLHSFVLSSLVVVFLMVTGAVEEDVFDRFVDLLFVGFELEELPASNEVDAAVVADESFLFCPILKLGFLLQVFY